MITVVLKFEEVCGNWHGDVVISSERLGPRSLLQPIVSEHFIGSFPGDVFHQVQDFYWQQTDDFK